MSTEKIMISVFWDAEGVSMTNCLAKDKTVTETRYANLLRQLKEELKS